MPKRLLSGLSVRIGDVAYDDGSSGPGYACEMLGHNTMRGWVYTWVLVAAYTTLFYEISLTHRYRQRIGNCTMNSKTTSILV